MIRWKKLYKNIPQNIKTSKSDTFEILWIDDPNLHGETHYNPDTKVMHIRLNKNDGAKDSIHTYFHEFLHALSYSNNLELTETEVRNIEKCFPQFYKFFTELNKDFPAPRKSKSRKREGSSSD